MRTAVVLCCICYWLLLTTLLLVPNPAGMVGLSAVPTFPWGKFGVHLIAFTLLAVQVHATRWPKRVGWSLIIFLVLYGITTESLQLFVPHRTARIMDGIENILGILAGSGIYWCARRLIEPLGLSLAAQLVKYPNEAEASVTAGPTK